MLARTDLALERKEMSGIESMDGVTSESEISGVSKVTRIYVTNAGGAHTLEKPIGKYITIEVPAFSGNAELFDGRIEVLSGEISRLIPSDGTVLVAGLGNMDITPDSLGPRAISFTFATRHIQGDVAKSAGLSNLRSVAAASTGVLGNTGMETLEIIKGLVDSVKPAAVIVIDALASRNLSRLGCTVQITDTGISPGSGVGNRRNEISSKNLGIPVIAVGVPTVVDASTLVCDLANPDNDEKAQEIRNKIEPKGERMIVTPREIDLLVQRAAKYVAMGINCALNPSIDAEDIFSLVAD